MKASINKAILLLLFVGIYVNGKADHLMGGDLSYTCVGSNVYQVNLTVYRNCNSTNQNLDTDADFTVFNALTRTVIKQFNIPLVSQTLIPNPPSTPCFRAPSQGEVCVELLQYQGTVSLPASTTGYILAYQRCCRNPVISNLFNVSQVGSTLTIDVPPSTIAACNSSPAFNSSAPNFLCINSLENINFSASDVNGDQLRYSLCAPKQGADFNDPRPATASRPPYTDVVYNNGYSVTRPLGNGSSVSIDSLTGQLSILTTNVGVFTIGICVSEYKNGVLIGKITRDYQLNVIDCNLANALPTVITDNSTSSAIKINDSTFSNCQGATVRFDNVVNQGGNTYFWDFGVPNRTDDTSTIKNPTYVYADTGTYYATLILNKGKPCSDTSRIKIFYYPGLVTDFNYTPKCQNEVIQFTDATTSVYNDVNQWKWVLLPGDTAVLQNPTKTYTSPGTYTIQLFTSTSKGCIGKATKSITVHPKPVANFTASFLCYQNTSVFTDASTISSGSIVKYNWSFGDGFSDTLKNAIHTYNTFADSFSVKHIVTTASGCKDSIIKKIKMDDTIKISYTTTPTSLCEKLPVTFTNTSTGGNPTGFQWIINNGIPVNGNTTTVTFPSGGIYPVLLIGTNRCGKDTLKSTITINANPIINVGNDITVCNKSTKTITASGAFDSLRWNTNETSSTIQVDGNKSPINIIVYKNGCIGKDTILVKKQIITPNFSNNFLCLNKPISFNNTSTVNSGTLVQYDWKYSDGNADNNIQTPIHVFSPFGNYNVQLIATSDIGCKDTIRKTIAMDSVLQVDFKTAELISCQRKAVDFIDITKGGFNNQNIWRIENNNFITKDESYTFLGTGIFPVKLVVSNRCYSDSITKNIQVRPRPSVYIGRDTILCKNQKTSFTVNPSLYDSIRWINGSTAATVITDGSINPFKIKVYLDQCAAEDTVLVVAPKFNLDFSNNFLCYNKPITFNNTSTVTVGNIANYNWNFGDGQTVNGIKSPSHIYTNFGPKTVQLIATGSVGACMDTIKKNLLMDDSIAFSVNPIPDEVCYGKSVLYTNNSTGGVNTTYLWNLNNANAQTTTIANYTHTFVGINTIKLTANHRCGADSIKYNFNVLPLPTVSLGNDSIIMCPGEIKMIGINAASDSIFWSTGDRDVDSIAINGLISPIKVDVYNKGCLAKDSITVSTNCDIFIPTAFSPNYDRINDALNMINKSIKSYTLKIFDRWGELIFETNSFSNSWNGTYKGEPCAVDDYTYIAYGIKSNNESFYLKGIITLVR